MSRQPAPAVLDEVKYVIRRVKLEEAKVLAEFALRCDSPSQILMRCAELALQTAPSLFENKAAAPAPPA